MKKAGFGIRGSDLGMVLAIVLASFDIACHSSTAPKVEGPFPPTGEVAGWARTGETRTFPAADLWQYIDGDAERYIQAGVEKTLTSDYRFQGKTDAVADIYIMKGADGPKKLIESEYAADSQPAAVGDDGRLFASSLVFRKGRYLVRVIAYQENPEIGVALMQLAQAIEKRLGAEG